MNHNRITIIPIEAHILGLVVTYYIQLRSDLFTYPNKFWIKLHYSDFPHHNIPTPRLCPSTWKTIEPYYLLSIYLNGEKDDSVISVCFVCNWLSQLWIAFFKVMYHFTVKILQIFIKTILLSLKQNVRQFPYPQQNIMGLYKLWSIPLKKRKWTHFLRC